MFLAAFIGMNDLTRNLFIGTSGYTYDRWIGDFYPAEIVKSKLLEFYVTKFISVEINSTFYKLPRRQTIDKWMKLAGSKFVFTFKASRFITHVKRLKTNHLSLERFFDPLQGLANVRGKHCILYQLPDNFKKNLERLETFLKAIPPGYRHAFEFRHSTWFDDDVYRLMKKYRAAIVLNDSPKTGKSRMWPLVLTETAPLIYLRFHGSKALYTSRYTDAELKRYAMIMAERLKKKHLVYAYFNNDSNGYAPHDALRLRRFVENIVDTF